jgi:hypothetical protein
VPTTSELPDIDAEDDSSFAWAIFRQNFADGGSRVLARRQRGTQFDPPVPVDAGDEATTDPRIEINGRGVGLATAAGTGTNQPIVNVLEDDKLAAGVRMGGIGLTTPHQVPVAAENNDALVAAIIGPAGAAPFVRLRPFDDGKSQAEVTLSKAELGPVDPGAGFDVASDRAFDVVAAWVQGGRLVAGFLDRAPLTFTGFTNQKCCRPAAPRLDWAAAFDLWGAVSYDVLVDKKVVGRTTATGLQLTKPLAGGTHRWQVVATDIRGQQTRSRTRLLRVDGLRPRQTIRYRRKGRTVTLSVRGRDIKRAGQRSSGIGSVRVAWGDGARTSGRSRVSARHRYRRSGSFALVVTTRDKAGNQVVRRRTVRIGG